MLNLSQIDQFLFKLINQNWATQALDSTMWVLSFPYTWIPVYLLILFVIYKKFKKQFWIPVICLVLAVGLSDSISSRIFKPLVKRVRPCNEASLSPRVPYQKSISYGFMSSHAANHAAICMFMLLIFKRTRWIYLFIPWVLAISYSRVYLGLHYPGDVLAGMALGCCMGWLCFRLFSFQMKKRTKT